MILKYSGIFQYTFIKLRHQNKCINIASRYSCTLCNIYDIYTVYRRIINPPATIKLAIGDENKAAHCFAFFSACQKTLKFQLIR